MWALEVGNFVICTGHKLLGASVCWEHKECVQNFGEETYWKIVTWKTEKEMVLC